MTTADFFGRFFSESSDCIKSTFFDIFRLDTFITFQSKYICSDVSIVCPYVYTAGLKKSDQGCQIFPGSTHQNGKNIYQMTVNYTKWPQNIPTSLTARPSKIYIN
jgi:hypothetical protein